MASSGVILNVPVSNYTTPISTSSFTAVTAHSPRKTSSSAGTSSVTAAAGALIRGVSSASAALHSPNYKAKGTLNLHTKQYCPRPSQKSQGATSQASVTFLGSSSDTAHSASCSITISKYTLEDKANESAIIGSKRCLGIGDPFSWDFLSNLASSELVTMPLSKPLTAVCTEMANMAGHSCTCCFFITSPISVGNEKTRHEGTTLSSPQQSRVGTAGDSSFIESNTSKHQFSQEQCLQDTSEVVEVGEEYKVQLCNYLHVVGETVQRTDMLNVAVPCQTSCVEEDVHSWDSYSETLLTEGATLGSSNGDKLAEESSLESCNNSKESFDLGHTADDSDRECDMDEPDDSIAFPLSGNVSAADCISDDNDGKSPDFEAGEKDCETYHCNRDDSDYAIELCNSTEGGNITKVINNNCTIFKNQQGKNYNDKDSDSDDSGSDMKNHSDNDTGSDFDSDAEKDFDSDSDNDSDCDTDCDSDTDKGSDSDTDNDSGSDPESNLEFSEDSDDGIQFGNFDDMDSDDDLSFQISFSGSASLSSALPVTKKSKFSKLADVVDSRKLHSSRVDRENPCKLARDATFDLFNENDNMKTCVRKANSRWQRYYPKPDVSIEKEIEVVFELLPDMASKRPLRADSKPLQPSLKLGGFCGVHWSPSSIPMTTSWENTPDIQIDHCLVSERVYQSHDRMTDVCFEESLTISTCAFSSSWSEREEKVMPGCDEVDGRFCADKTPPTSKSVPTRSNDTFSSLDDLFLSFSIPPSASLTASNYHLSTDGLKTDLQPKNVPQHANHHSLTSSLKPLKCASLSSELYSAEFQATLICAPLEVSLASVKYGSKPELARPNHQHQSQPSSSCFMPAYCGQTRQQTTTLPQLQSFSASSKTTKDARMTHTTGEGGRTLKQRVSLNLLVKTRVLRTWHFAHSEARKGGYWMQCARDRLRFKNRVETVARTVEPVLTKNHRERVWTRMDHERSIEN